MVTSRDVFEFVPLASLFQHRHFIGLHPPGEKPLIWRVVERRWHIYPNMSCMYRDKSRRTGLVSHSEGLLITHRCDLGIDQPAPRAVGSKDDFRMIDVGAELKAWP